MSQYKSILEHRFSALCFRKPIRAVVVAVGRVGRFMPDAERKRFFDGITEEFLRELSTCGSWQAEDALVEARMAGQRSEASVVKAKSSGGIIGFVRRMAFLFFG